MTPKQEKQRRTLITDAHRDYSKGLTSHAFFKLHNRSMSDDLVQDTFIKTWNYLVKKGKIDLMKSFLYRILNDLIVDEYRKHKPVSLDVLLEKGYEPSADPRDHLVNLLDGKSALLLIAHLPDKYRKMVQMRYVQNLTLKEIATLTGKSRNTIAVQLHRGLNKLRVLHNQK
jgi:RNA polymerase sigma-70 factor, ECF subfamily